MQHVEHDTPMLTALLIGLHCRTYAEHVPAERVTNCQAMPFRHNIYCLPKYCLKENLSIYVWWGHHVQNVGIFIWSLILGWLLHVT